MYLSQHNNSLKKCSGRHWRSKAYRAARTTWHRHYFASKIARIEKPRNIRLWLTYVITKAKNWNSRETDSESQWQGKRGKSAESSRHHRLPAAAPGI